jgi:lamin tail-like protein
VTVINRFFARCWTGLALGVSVFGLSACSSSTDVTDFSLEPAEDMGSLGLELALSPEVELASVAWQVTGNGFSKAGSADVSDSESVSLLIGGIPAGNGFTMTLSGSAAGFGCTGSATFDVRAGETTRVALTLRCRPPRSTGGVVVDGQTNVCPTIDALSAAPLLVNVGGRVRLEAEASDLDAAPSALTYSWQSDAGPISGASSAAATLTCAVAGAHGVSLTVSDGDCSDTLAISVTCEDVAGGGDEPLVRINEVESNAGVPGDWVELYNAGTASADLSGWAVLDNDDTHRYVLPAGTTLGAGEYLIVEEASLGYGLGGADSVRLFPATGTTAADSYSWTAHATTTYGRCPDGDGGFVTTLVSSKGLPNACPSDPTTPTVRAWPGSDDVVTLDAPALFAGNMSGITYEPSGDASPGALWAVQNNPSRVYLLEPDGAGWAPPPIAEWAIGKTLRYPDGTGVPDSEGVTFAEYSERALYVATERNNDVSGTSRLSVLRVLPETPGTTLNATHEWNLTADLPAVGPNLGLEAITWIPDAVLVQRGLVDESTGAAYSPAAYPGHGTGLFVVGVEGTGLLHAYALDQSTQGFQRIASFSSGHPGVMGLEYDRETGYLWAACDDTCQGRQTILEVQTSGAGAGRFAVISTLARPTSLANLNDEGIAIAPEAECVNGFKGFFWVDDGDTDGHALRGDAIPCGRFLP